MEYEVHALVPFLLQRIQPKEIFAHLAYRLSPGISYLVYRSHLLSPYAAGSVQPITDTPPLTPRGSTH